MYKYSSVSDEFGFNPKGDRLKIMQAMHQLKLDILANQQSAQTQDNTNFAVDGNPLNIQESFLPQAVRKSSNNSGLIYTPKSIS